MRACVHACVCVRVVCALVCACECVCVEGTSLSCLFWSKYEAAIIIAFLTT